MAEEQAATNRVERNHLLCPAVGLCQRVGGFALGGAVKWAAISMVGFARCAAAGFLFVPPNRRLLQPLQPFLEGLYSRVLVLDNLSKVVNEAGDLFCGRVRDLRQKDCLGLDFGG